MPMQRYIQNLQNTHAVIQKGSLRNIQVKELQNGNRGITFQFLVAQYVWHSSFRIPQVLEKVASQ